MGGSCAKFCAKFDCKEEPEMYTPETSVLASGRRVNKSPNLFHDIVNLEGNFIKVQALVRGFLSRRRLLAEEVPVRVALMSKEEIAETLGSGRITSFKPVLKPEFVSRTGSIYKGEWIGGFRHGYGIMMWPNHCRYEGYWSYGVPYGEGKFVYGSGIEFSGEWAMLYLHLSARDMA